MSQTVRVISDSSGVSVTVAWGTATASTPTTTSTTPTETTPTETTSPTSSIVVTTGECSADVCLSLAGSSLNYASAVDIGGFQFDHDGCVDSASGGDAEDNGFTVSASSSTVLAFSFTGSVVAAGSGTLVVLEGDVSVSCLSDFVF